MEKKEDNRGIVLSSSPTRISKSTIRALNQFRRTFSSPAVAEAMKAHHRYADIINPLGSVMQAQQEQMARLVNPVQAAYDDIYALIKPPIFPTYSDILQTDIWKSVSWQYEWFEALLPNWMFESPFQKLVEQSILWPTVPTLENVNVPFPTFFETDSEVLSTTIYGPQRGEHPVRPKNHMVESPACGEIPRAKKDDNSSPYLVAMEEYARRKNISPNQLVKLMDSFYKMNIGSTDSAPQALGIHVPDNTLDESLPIQIISSRAIFTDDGKFYRVLFKDKEMILEKSAGTETIRILTDHPDRAFSAIELRCLVKGQNTDLIPPFLTGEIDHKTLSDAKERLRDIEAELEQSKRWHDFGTVSRLENERNTILEEVHYCQDLKKQNASNNPEMEKARKAVYYNIDRALKSIQTDYPLLEKHLRICIKTGHSCSYSPTRHCH